MAGCDGDGNEGVDGRICSLKFLAVLAFSSNTADEDACIIGCCWTLVAPTMLALRRRLDRKLSLLISDVVDALLILLPNLRRCKLRRNEETVSMLRFFSRTLYERTWNIFGDGRVCVCVNGYGCVNFNKNCAVFFF